MAVMLLLLTLASAAALPSTPWEALRLAPNDLVQVETSESTPLKGRIVEATADQLVIQPDGRDRVHVSIASITRLRVRRHGGSAIGVGALLGALLGGGLGAVGGLTASPGSIGCGDCGGPLIGAIDLGKGPVIAAGVLLGAVAGAVAGAVTPHWKERDVHRVQVHLAPTRGLGLAVAVSLGSGRAR